MNRDELSVKIRSSFIDAMRSADLPDDMRAITLGQVGDVLGKTFADIIIEAIESHTHGSGN